MAKRAVSPPRLRDIVRARLTKGDAFRIAKHEEYAAKQAEVAARLEAMSARDILETYPEYTYDLKLD